MRTASTGRWSEERGMRLEFIQPGLPAQNAENSHSRWSSFWGLGQKEEFRRKVKEEPSELIYFKLYKSQIPVIEQAIETTARMLCSDRSRGYCLEMICADFSAAANTDCEDPEILLHSVCRYYRFLPRPQKEYSWRTLKVRLCEETCPEATLKIPARCLTANYIARCQVCGTISNLEVHHKRFRSRAGTDSEQNLITLCSGCHADIHRGLRSP